jgi:hypothetical protein
VTFPAVAVQNVTEVDLENPTNRVGLGAWSCPSSLQFRIIRPEDLAEPGANCVKKPDPSVVSPTSALGIVRNSLKTEDWYIDMTNRCIIPKRSSLESPSCYGNIKKVTYAMGDGCVEAGEGICVAIASVCYRTN